MIIFCGNNAINAAEIESIDPNNGDSKKDFPYIVTMISGRTFGISESYFSAIVRDVQREQYITFQMRDLLTQWEKLGKIGRLYLEDLRKAKKQP